MTRDEFKCFQKSIGQDPDPPPESIARRWAEYHTQHPEVFAYLRALALESWSKGKKHGGCRLYYEQVRWHFRVEKGNEEFKLSDNFISRYARYLMFKDERLKGFFRLRPLKTK